MYRSFGLSYVHVDLKTVHQQVQEQDVVTSCDLGGSVADLAADVSLVENLLSQETEALHLLLVNQHLLLPTLITDTHQR